MKEDKKDHILHIAEKLFALHGYDGASTRAIAQEAGVNLAMLNYYFGSKEGVYKAVLQSRLVDFHQILSNINEENISPWDKLKKCIELYVDRVFANNCFHKLIQRELSLEKRSESSDIIISSIMNNVNEIKKVLENGIQSGTFREVDIEMTIASIFGTKYYLLNTSIIASRIFDMDLNVDQVRDEEIKPRLKKHLMDLLSAHLRKI